MTGPEQAALERMHGLAAALAAAGIAPGPEKQIDFLRAIALTTPPSLSQLYWTARVTLVTRAEDIEVFDVIFAAWFGESVSAALPPADAPGHTDGDPAGGRPADLGAFEITGVREGSGRDASRHELLAEGQFFATTAGQARMLAEIRHALRRSLPQTRARRCRPARRGSTLDLRRVARRARATGGEVTGLSWRERPGRARRVLMLIDVSGSLRATSADALRLAHVLVRELPRSDAYTFGTRLTRVSNELRRRDPDAALAGLSEVVADVNGGTRIGAAFTEFLGDGRRVAAARDAVVIIVSDGLERGDPALMAQAVGRLAHLAYRVVWWSPLACDPRYQPVTRGMAAVVAELDDLVGVADLQSGLRAVRRLSHLGLGLSQRSIGPTSPPPLPSAGHAQP